MKNLIIIGARGFGIEVYNWALQCREYNTEWIIKGFLDDNKSALEANTGYNIPILSSVENYDIKENDVFICALGDVKQKKKYSSLILDKGGEFINIVHPLACVNSRNIKLGKGIIIVAFALVSNDVTLGDFVTLQSHCAIGHNSTIGDWCQINSFSHFGGNCEIGENVTINPGAIILPKVKIGDNATVGAGSVVLKNVESNVTVFGNPAKKIF